MQAEEFEKVWTLYRTLFPAASARISSPNVKMTWQVALSPYAMDDVVNASMEWARKNKFLPDIADITGGLHREIPEGPAACTGKDRAADMLPLIQKFYGSISQRRKEQLHAAGVETWNEARIHGVSWLDWLGQCRAVFGERIFPLEEDPAQAGEV